MVSGRVDVPLAWGGGCIFKKTDVNGGSIGVVILH